MRSGPVDETADEALELAGELRERIGRERATVRALKEHLISAGEPAEPVDLGVEDEERLRAPTREAPASALEWEHLGECLRCLPVLFEDGRLELELAGEVDRSGALRLRHLLQERMDEGARTVVLRLAEVGFMDSTGLSTLLWARRQAGVLDGSLQLVDVSPQLQRLFRVTRLHAILLPET